MNKRTDKMRQRFNKLKSKAGRDAMLPVCDSFLMEMADEGELTIKGCHDVLTYCCDNVNLMTDSFMMIVRGEELLLKTFGTAKTTIGGKILSIEFVR